MGEYKRKFGIYAAWTYKLKLEEFNNMSEQGWQLLEAGLFSRRYKRNPEVQYRYQMDFHPNIEDKGRYIETFREQGWEYVNSSFNGWNYFRKLYDASRPEEKYEIFTDTSSAWEMNNRWLVVGTVASVVLGLLLAAVIFMMLTQPALWTLVCLLYVSFVFGVGIRGIIVMRQPGKSKITKWDKYLMNVLFLVLTFGTVGSILLVENRTNFSWSHIAESCGEIPKNLEKATEWIEFDVNYSDNYYLDLEVDAAAPVCISVVDETGTVIYSVVAEEKFEEDNTRLQLEKGKYSIYFSDFPGGRLNVTASMD